VDHVPSNSQSSTEEDMSDKCPNCGFHIELSPRERRSLNKRIESLEADLQRIADTPMYLQSRRDNYADKAHKMHGIAAAALDKEKA